MAAKLIPIIALMSVLGAASAIAQGASVRAGGGSVTVETTPLMAPQPPPGSVNDGSGTAVDATTTPGGQTVETQNGPRDKTGTAQSGPGGAASTSGSASNGGGVSSSATSGPGGGTSQTKTW